MPFALGLHPYFQVESLGQARLEGLPAEATVGRHGSDELILILERGGDQLPQGLRDELEGLRKRLG